MLYKTEGIILKSYEYQDADKIVSIYSEKQGKIKAIAKGVRKTKSKFGSSMEVLTCAEFLFYRGRNLDIVSQSKIIDSFFGTCADLKKYALAINCAEVINKLIEDKEINLNLYTLFKEFLRYIKEAKDPVLLALSFKWKVLGIIGYKPALYRCYKCQKKTENEQYMFFKIPDGGITCDECARLYSGDYIKITRYFVKLLKKIFIASLLSISKATIPEIRRQELERLTNIYLTYYSDSIFKTERFLREI